MTGAASGARLNEEEAKAEEPNGEAEVEVEKPRCGVR